MQTTDARSDTQQAIVQGKKLRQEGKLEEAIASFQQAIELDAQSYEGYHFFGETLAQQDKLEAAAEAYQKAIEINPEYFWSYHCFGQVLFWQGKLDEASSALHKAIQLNSNKAALHYQLGEILAKKGDFKTAEDAYKKAIQIKPDFQIAIAELDKVQQQQQIKEKSYQGSLEEIDGCLLKGWVWNSKYPKENVSLIVYQQDREIFGFTANSYRKDLEQRKIGSGNHGFAVKLPLDICKADPFDLKIKVKDSNYILNNSSTKFEYIHDYKPTFQGFCEPITKEGKIKGWALDNEDLGKEINLSIYDGNDFLLKIPANIYRQDIHQWKKGEGCYGYWLDYLEIMLNCKNHKLTICFENSATELENSPITIDRDHTLSIILRRVKTNLSKIVSIGNNL